MKRAPCGFTLVEMLVALSVSALLVSLVYGGVRIGHRSAQALGVHSAQAEVMRIGWQFLRDAVVRAQAVPDPADPKSRTGFQGTHSTVQFIADMPGHVVAGGLMRIRLGIETGPEGNQLVLTRTSLEQDDIAVSDEDTSRAVLVDDLENLEIEYLGQLGRDSFAAWHTSWDAPRTLPNLLRISIQPATGQAWPILIAGPLKGTAALSAGGPPTEPTEQLAPGAVP